MERHISRTTILKRSEELTPFIENKTNSVSTFALAPVLSIRIVFLASFRDLTVYPLHYYRATHYNTTRRGVPTMHTQCTSGRAHGTKVARHWAGDCTEYPLHRLLELWVAL